MHTTDIQIMPHSNFELSDNYLNLKSYITNTSFARCRSVITFHKWICQHCTVILLEFIMTEEAEKMCPLFYVIWDMSSVLVMDVLP
jgi:hypothetical protein